MHDGEKWTKYYLAPAEVVGLRAMRADPRLTTVGACASIDVGVVTGRNSFFTMTAEEADALGLTSLTKALVSRSAQLVGVSFTESDAELQAAMPIRTRLLDVPADVSLDDDELLRRHVTAGEAEDVHLGYKCRIRREWWRVPSTASPDGFMLRQIHRYPRIFGNETGATSTDTVHRVTIRVPELSAEQLAVAALNSITFAAAEIVGRSYGGGILELEPSEAEHLPLPSPTLVGPALISKVDELLREGRPDEATELVDQSLLVDALGMDPDQVLLARSAWQRLRDRRGSRGRSSRQVSPSRTARTAV